MRREEATYTGMHEERLLRTLDEQEIYMGIAGIDRDNLKAIFESREMKKEQSVSGP